MSLDPMDDMVNLFHQHAPFEGEDLKKRARQILESKRVYPSAHYSKVASLSGAAKNYIVGLGGFERAEEKTRRLRNIIKLLTDEKSLRVENSRVLVAIFKSLSALLNACNRQLADSFRHEIIDEWAGAMYMNLWNTAFHKSKELEQTQSGTFLSKLCFFSAFLADLHAEGVVEPSGFHHLTRATLPLIQCPKLFDIFLLHFVSRNLTASGRKLGRDAWYQISLKWKSFQALYQPNPITGAIIRILYKDAMEGGAHCGIAWSHSPSKAADQFCDELINKIFLRDAEDDDEEMAVDGELAEAMSRTQLDCPSDGLVMSFHSISMN